MINVENPMPFGQTWVSFADFVLQAEDLLNEIVACGTRSSAVLRAVLQRRQKLLPTIARSGFPAGINYLIY